MQLDEAAKLFLQYDYAEAKALCTQFLTVVLAVLVFSLTFSEKVADFPRATLAVKAFLLAAWCLFMVAILLGGAAIYYLALAGGEAVSGGGGYYQLESTAMSFAVGGGTVFVIGLVSLMITAALTVIKAKAPAA